MTTDKELREAAQAQIDKWQALMFGPPEALREALAEPAEHQDSSWCMRMNGCKTKCEDCPDEVPKQSAEQPMFWYRPRSDGCYEGPIHNAQIEQVRKESGGWHPLYTAPQPAIPPGYKLVPVEPTHNMILAGACDPQTTPRTAKYSYRAMLNAAPEVPQPAKREGLTDEEIAAHFREHIATGSLLSFADGVRFAERAYGITKGGA